MRLTVETVSVKVQICAAIYPAKMKMEASAHKLLLLLNMYVCLKVKDPTTFVFSENNKGSV